MTIGQIEDLANTVLKQYGNPKIPIDPVLIANRIGIRVYEGIFKDPANASILLRNEKEILLDSKLSFRMKRFIIACQLGHFMMHPGSEIKIHKYYYEDPAYKITQEQEARKFAAALLMPTEYLLHEMEYHGELIDRCSDMVIEYLACKFIVPNDVVLSRLFELGWNGALI